MAWVRLSRRFGPEFPIPAACVAGTLEYRGQPEVSDALGEADASGLFRFLQRRGLVAGDPGPLPAPQGETVDLRAIDVVKAPTSGILSYRAPLGASVQKGEAVADIIDPMAPPGAARTQAVSAADGLLFARRMLKLVRAGEIGRAHV